MTSTVPALPVKVGGQRKGGKAPPREVEEEEEEEEIPKKRKAPAKPVAVAEVEGEEGPPIVAAITGALDRWASNFQKSLPNPKVRAWGFREGPRRPPSRPPRINLLGEGFREEGEVLEATEEEGEPTVAEEVSGGALVGVVLRAREEGRTEESPKVREGEGDPKTTGEVSQVGEPPIAASDAPTTPVCTRRAIWTTSQASGSRMRGPIYAE